jgi:hypothetical protein
MRRHFYLIPARARIPTRPQTDGTQGLRLHDLRQRCSTLLISLGVKPKTRTDNPAALPARDHDDLYVHAYDEDLCEAVVTLDRALGS